MDRSSSADEEPASKKRRITSPKPSISRQTNADYSEKDYDSSCGEDDSQDPLDTQQLSDSDSDDSLEQYNLPKQNRFENSYTVEEVSVFLLIVVG